MDSITNNEYSSFSAFDLIAQPAPPMIFGSPPINQTTTPGTPMRPFEELSVVDDSPSAIQTLTITVDGWDGELVGIGLTRIDRNTYQLTGSAVEVTAALQGLTFWPNLKSGPQEMGMNRAIHFTLTDVSSANPDGPPARFETEVRIAVPFEITSGEAAIWNENVTDTMFVYTVSTEDPYRPPFSPSPGQKTYSLSGDDADLFNIDSRGNVTFKASPNFEKPADRGGDNVYNITVTVSDGSSTASKDVAITVTDQVMEFTQNLTTADTPQTVAIADLNGDHKLDLVVSNLFSKSVSVLRGNGDGTFTQTATCVTGWFPGSIAIADLNGDNKADIIVRNDDATVSVLIGNGNGTFKPQVTYATGPGYGQRSLAVADFNGDGKMDVAVSNFSDGAAVSVLLGNGDGTFQQQAIYGTGRSPEHIAVADLNGDGKVDLIVSDNGGLSILLGLRLGAARQWRPHPEQVGVARNLRAHHRQQEHQENPWRDRELYGRRLHSHHRAQCLACEHDHERHGGSAILHGHERRLVGLDAPAAGAIADILRLVSVGDEEAAHQRSTLPDRRPHHRARLSHQRGCGLWRLVWQFRAAP